MRLAELAMLYGLVGLGCAVCVVLKHPAGAGRWVDAGLLLFFWPLHGPFILLRLSTDHDSPSVPASFMQTLRSAQTTALGSLLPDEVAVRALTRRLEDAVHKIEEIDRLLAQPDFSEAAALSRQRELEARGDPRAAMMVASRVQDIRRLRSLRGRFASELDEVGELLAKLRIQAELVRLSGTHEGVVQELTQELMSRVEGLDAILDDNATEQTTEASARHG